MSKNPDPTRGVARSNEVTNVARELTLPAAAQRYRDIAQLGTDPDKGYRLHFPAMTWVPLTEDQSLKYGFAEQGDFCLVIPKREVIIPSTGLSAPWFFSADRYMPLFPEATDMIAAFCDARLDPNTNLAFNGTPMMGALPGFFYEAEKSMGFRVNPQSFYASHVIFFTTGYTLNGKLTRAAKIATESSIRMYTRNADDSVVTMIVLPAHLLSQALDYPNTLAMLNDLFITPFNTRYIGAEMLRTMRGNEVLPAIIDDKGGQMASDFASLVIEFNSAVETYWSTYSPKQPHQERGTKADGTPRFTVAERVLIYTMLGHERYLRLNSHNLSVLKRMVKIANEALAPDMALKERRQVFRKILSVDEALDEYGQRSSASIQDDKED